MVILLIFAFISGLVTIFAPCIWPLLPIILSSSTSGGKQKPLGVTLGVVTSFALYTLTISYIVHFIPLDPNALRLVAVVVIGFLGLTLVVPALNQVVEGWVSRLSSRFGPAQKNGSGFWGGYITGFSLGLVWTPCAGPILATIATLAATQAVNFQIILVTLAYVVGVAIPLFLFATAGQRFFTTSRWMGKYTHRVQQVFGVIMILTALAIYTNYDKVIQAKLLDAFPSYSQFLTTLENTKPVQTELNKIKGDKTVDPSQMPFPVASDKLPDLGVAPNFVGIDHWLNSPPLNIADLKGKVVLVDFWTYTCINCIRTLPYVTSWYEKYKGEGFVVVGVHTPEFEFEKNTQNVENALKQYNIHYPVAQDNEYKTWTAYDNHYWPAKYLVDANGHLRWTHFGEGDYDLAEMNIKKLLKEAGQKTDMDLIQLKDQTPTLELTPETYMGLNRLDPSRYASNEQPTEGVSSYTPFPSVPLDAIGYSGQWNLQPEYAQATPGSKLYLGFVAGKVFLVFTPKSDQDVVNVLLDGKPISDAVAGKDVKNGQIVFDKARLYELVDLKGKVENHLLRLDFGTDGTQIFAFTFGQ